jgi:hypothetical protein
MGLVGSVVKCKGSVADIKWDGCPQPHLRLASAQHRRYRVVEARKSRQRIFVKCQLHSPHAMGEQERPAESLGWIPVASTDAKVQSEADCLAVWRSMQRRHSGRPYNGTFSAPLGSRAICGQLVRIDPLPKAPAFCSSQSGPDGGRILHDTCAADVLAKDIPSTRHKMRDSILAARADKAVAGSQSSASKTSRRTHKEQKGGAEPRPCMQDLLDTGEPHSQEAAGGPSGALRPQLPATAHLPQGLLMGSNSFACAIKAVCFLPSWAMRALEVGDGDEVVVEALGLPLNRAGRAMVASDKARTWHCGGSKCKTKCEPGRLSCADCRAVDAPDLSGGVAPACRVAWRLQLGDAPVGEVEVMLRDRLGALLKKRLLACIKAGMTIPIEWGAQVVSLAAESVVDEQGSHMPEAALSATTHHTLLPPIKARDRVPVSGGAPQRSSETQQRACRDALLSSEMMSDYLEQAARDGVPPCLGVRQ